MMTAAVDIMDIIKTFVFFWSIIFSVSPACVQMAKRTAAGQAALYTVSVQSYPLKTRTEFEGYPDLPYCTV